MKNNTLHVHKLAGQLQLATCMATCYGGQQTLFVTNVHYNTQDMQYMNNSYPACSDAWIHVKYLLQSSAKVGHSYMGTDLVAIPRPLVPWGSLFILLTLNYIASYVDCYVACKSSCIHSHNKMEHESSIHSWMCNYINGTYLLL